MKYHAVTNAATPSGMYTNSVSMALMLRAFEARTRSASRADSISCWVMPKRRGCPWR